MVSFSGRTVGITEDADRWGRYLGGVDQRRQQRWLNNEQRSELDRANRYNRAEAQSNQQFMERYAHLFNNTDAELGGFRPQNVPQAAGLQGIPSQATAPATSAAPPTPGLPAGRVSGLQPSNLPEHDRMIHAPADPDTLNEEERAAVAAYARVAGQTVDTSSPYMGRPNVGNRPQSGPQVEAARNRLRELGLDFRNGQLVRTAGVNTPESMRFSSLFEEQETGTPENSAAAGLTEEVEVPQENWFGGDTSRGLRPTREMQMLEMNVANNIRRAQLASQHGRNDIADAAFTAAIQGQATYIQEGRSVALRAVGSGNVQAAEWLIEQYNGYPDGTVALQQMPGSAGMYRIQMQNDDGDWVAAPGQPMTISQIYNGLNNLVDREGAAARAEVSASWQEHLLEAQTDLQVATINLAGDQIDAETRLRIAQMDNTTREAIAAGRATFFQDNNTGRVFVSYPGADADGTPGRVILELPEIETRSADTNSRERTNQTIAREIPLGNITGTVGVRASNAQ